MTLYRLISLHLLPIFISLIFLISSGCYRNKPETDHNSKLKVDILDFMDRDYMSFYDALQNGADVNVKGVWGMSPLHYAVSKNDYKRCELLIDYGVNVNAVNNSLETPIFFCSKIDIAKLLISKGANIEHMNKYRETPLIFSIDRKDYNMSKFFINNGVNINYLTGHRKTPLSFACEMGSFDIADLLIKRGANINIKLINNQTALQLSVIKGFEKIVVLLLENGALVNTRDNLKQTPLHYAALNGDIEMVKLLLDYGASPSIEDINGYKPIDMAIRLRPYYDVDKVRIDRDKVIDLLRKKEKEERIKKFYPTGSATSNVSPVKRRDPRNSR